MLRSLINSLRKCMKISLENFCMACIKGFSKIQPVVYYQRLRSDWLSYYQAISYSPLVEKSVGFLAAKKD